MTPNSKIPKNITDTQFLRSMAKRRGIDLKTIARKFLNQSKPVENTAAPQLGQLGMERTNTSLPVKNIKHDVQVEDPDKPSVDLSHQPKGIIRKIKLFPGKIKRIYRLIRPLPTDEQLEEMEIARIEKSRDKLCMKEGIKYGKLASAKLAQLGMRELILSPDPNKPKKLKLVRWDMITRDALFNKIVLHMDTDPHHLPHYVVVSKLGRDQIYSDEMLPTLGKYSQWSSDEAGVTLTIFRHGLEGLPDFVTTNDLWKKCPSNQPPYTLAVGFGDNSSTHFVDPTSYPHLLVSGTTGWGKSMLINNFISFLLHRGRTPKELQFVLFDLKKGMEFSFYKNLPHLYKDEGEDPVIETGIIEDLEGVLPALRRMQEIRDERMDKIKKAGYKNWADYNLGEPMDKMPAIFLVFDEWAKIRLSHSGKGTRALAVSVARLAEDTVRSVISKHEAEHLNLIQLLKDFGKDVLKLRSSKHFGLEAEELLAEFTNLSRAAGMFVILATQHPSKEVLTGLIMINFPTRIILKSSIGGSMAALGTQSAFPIEHKGRAILLDRGIETKVQTPFISDDTIHSIVHKAITGEDVGIPSGISIETILLHALQKCNGILNGSELYANFREQHVRRDWLLNTLRSLEGKEVTLNGSKYLVGAKSGTTPRKLKLL
jgi:hypothetical protein